MDLADLSAAEMARRIRDGEITSEEVVEACIARITEREDTVKAWVHFDPEFARKQAERASVIRASGIPIGPLHGVPVGVKDIFDTEYLPTENGTVLDAGRTPVKDSTAVRLLKTAGAVVMGKTVTTEMAAYSPGKTCNPHDPARTPGGSSSGSAAAVASGMVPLAIGSQTKGSVIRPASFCGVVGFKPTHGMISRAGVFMQSRELDHVGVFARSLEDAALLSECLMGYDVEDPDTRPSAVLRLTETVLQEPPVEPRLAFVKTPQWDQADPSTQEAFTELAEFLGDRCDEIELPPQFETANADLHTILIADLAKNLARYVRRGKDQISDIMIGLIEQGAQVTAVDYNTCVDKRVGLNDWLQDICTEYDAILTPATIGEAPVGLEATGDPVFCSTWSYLGAPAVTVPLMQGENDMPLGVQLVSYRGDDARLLRNARWLAEEVVRHSDD